MVNHGRWSRRSKWWSPWAKSSPRRVPDETGSTPDQHPTPPSLWDAAYDRLSLDHRDLIAAYEDLLSRVLTAGQPSPIGAIPSTHSPEDAPAAETTTSQLQDDVDVSPEGNSFPSQDPVVRRKKLQRVMYLGLQYAENKKVRATVLGHELLLQDVTGNVAGAIHWTETYVKDVIRDLPYAPAVMAGIALILPLLNSPSIVEAANREGFAYVTSQMRYYVAMESLLLPEEMDFRVKDDLSARVQHLYQLIIHFQVQSILQFYRSRTKNYFRSIAQWDDWEGMFARVKSEEEDLRVKLDLALSTANSRDLRALLGEAEKAREKLAGILVGIQKLATASQGQMHLLERIHQRMSDAEDRKCHRLLHATDPSLDKARIERHKGGLLSTSYTWILSHTDFKRWRDCEENRLLWIRGDPGKGKTMLMCGLIEELARSTPKTTNLSFFFCQASLDNVNNASAALRGMIYMLVKQQPCLLSHLPDEIPDGHNAWFALCRALSHILDDPRLRNTFLIIDALDECTTGLDRLLELIAQQASGYQHIKWVVSSRNWPSIERDLGQVAQVELRLELNEDAVSIAVDAFIKSRVDWLTERHRYTAETQRTVEHYLSSNAKGTFLWAALVCSQLANVSKWNVERRIHEFPSGLDGLYRRMLDQICSSDDATLCKSILELLVAVYRPITLDEMAFFIDFPPGAVGDEASLIEITQLCGSFLTLRDDTLSLVHQSARDFLLDRGCDQVFANGITNVHHRIFTRSMHKFPQYLRRDVYQIHRPALDIENFEPPSPDPLEPTRYACIYWIGHLADCDPGQLSTELQDGGSIDIFLKQDFLHWIEALAFLRKLSDGVEMMLRLEGLLKRHATRSHLLARAQDACRFLRYHKGTIEQWPLQVYTSALIFSPAKSITRFQFQAEMPEWIFQSPAMEDNWSASVLTIKYLNHCPIIAVAWSPDGNLLASVSDRWSVAIYDAATGQLLTEFWDPSSPVTSITWSPDKTRLAMTSVNGCVKVWDVKTGQCLVEYENYIRSPSAPVNEGSDLTQDPENGLARLLLADLPNPSSQVNRSFPPSVRWCLEGLLVAMPSDDCTVQIFDAKTGHCKSTLKGHTTEVLSYAWSSTGCLIATASWDGSIKLWESATNKCISSSQDQNAVTVVAWSEDETKLASSAGDWTVTIWDTIKKRSISTLRGHHEEISSMSWSHSGSRLASAAKDATIKIWDASTGRCISTLEGHIGSVTSVAWSPDDRLLASTSRDGTTATWDMGAIGKKSAPDVHRAGIVELGLSADRSRLASTSTDTTLQILDATSHRVISTFTGHSDRIEEVQWSPNGTQLASMSGHRIWDIKTGQSFSPFKAHRADINQIAWSRDGTQIASAETRAIRLWNAVTYECISTIPAPTPSTTLAWSPDGTQLASGSRFGLIMIWNVATKEWIVQLDGHSDEVNRMAWSSEGQRLVSFSSDRTLRIWDAHTGCTLAAFGSIMGFYSDFRFDENNPDYLNTNHGTLDITPQTGLIGGSTRSFPPPQAVGYGQDTSGSWITYRGQNLIKLPQGCETLALVASPGTITLGTVLGRLLRFEFSAAEPVL